MPLRTDGLKLQITELSAELLSFFSQKKLPNEGKKLFKNITDEKELCDIFKTFFSNLVSNIKYLITTFISEIMKAEIPFQALQKHWKYIPVMLIFKKTHLNFSFRETNQEEKIKI